MNQEAKILITGDFCPINRANDLIMHEQYDTIFNDLLPIIQDADLAITNLECPLTNNGNKITKTGPLLKGSIKTADALSFAGFNLVTLANNHIMDYGILGLQSTLKACENNKIDHVGAGKDYNEARQTYFTKIGNYTVAILNFAENEFSTTHDSNPGANPIDPMENFRDISEAKSKADHVIVIVHGGHEMYTLPSPRIKNTFRFMADAGASAVLGHHSHCYSGYEIYNNVLIFYGLGNFIFDLPDNRNSIWNTGFAVELILKDVLEYNIIPYEQCNQQFGVRLMNDQGRKNFIANIENLNSIILDNDLLKYEFHKYCGRVRRMYFSFLEPHSILLLHYLRNRRIFPSFLSKRKKSLYLNLFRCESHRDVITQILSDSILTK
jgi:hypothetical protein